MRRKLPIFYSALLLTGVNLLLRFVSTSFQVYVSGKIGAAGVGLLQLVLSVGAMSVTLGMAGIRTASMYLCAGELGRRHPENITRVLSACVLYSILCSGTIAAALYFGAPFLAAHWIGDLRTVAALRVYASFLPITCITGVMTGYFTAANRIGTLAAVEVAEQLISMLLTMGILILWAGVDPAKACLGIVLGNGLSMCLTLTCLVVLRLRERAGTGASIPLRNRLLETAVPLALADDLKAGISTTENLMVPKRLALFQGIDDPLAAFGMVCGMVFPVLMFPAAILYGLAELLIPELARCAAAGSQQRISYLARRSLRVAIFYGCLFGGLEFILAETLCISLYNSTEAGKYLRLYALMIPMLYTDAITDAMIKGLGEQKASVRYNILTSAMDVFFLFLLLPRYGMAGYYFSFLLTHLINFCLSLRRLIKIVGNIISIRTPVLSLISAAVALWVSMLCSNLFFSCVGYLTIFGCLLVLFRVWGKEDLYWLRGLTAKK
ncbi:MAG: polysaccharide biosynthesis C-terminal domain-containing protein [Oscillospiraceae bacterium]|nr:polysaccharide biosynthesis C-terminal domain-containing protein [Oscillospiraceae bacterium]